jgi:hypothetical protein
MREEQIEMWTVTAEEVSPGSSGPPLRRELPLEWYSRLPSHLWDMAEVAFARFGDQLRHVGPTLDGERLV